MSMNGVAWLGLGLILIAAEVVAPGAFLLWMGIAAVVVALLVFVLPGLSLLAQVVLFVVLSVAAVLAYRKWFRKREEPSDRPLLNQRGLQMIGRTADLDQAIADGRGRIKLDDALWVVEGPDLPAGTRVRVVAIDGMTLKVQQA